MFIEGCNSDGKKQFVVAISEKQLLRVYFGSRFVSYKNRGSAIDDGYLDEFCNEYRDEDD